MGSGGHAAWRAWEGGRAEAAHIHQRVEGTKSLGNADSVDKDFTRYKRQRLPRTPRPRSPFRTQMTLLNPYRPQTVEIHAVQFVDTEVNISVNMQRQVQCRRSGSPSKLLGHSTQ